MRTKSRLMLVGLLVLGAWIWQNHGQVILQQLDALTGSGGNGNAPHRAVQAYKAAQRRGYGSEICTAAGEVVGAYRQAGNEQEAYRWTSIEAEDCRAAR